MTTMILHDALVLAGADDAAACDPAVAVSDHNRRLAEVGGHHRGGG